MILTAGMPQMIPGFPPVPPPAMPPFPPPFLPNAPMPPRMMPPIPVVPPCSAQPHMRRYWIVVFTQTSKVLNSAVAFVLFSSSNMIGNIIFSSRYFSYTIDGFF